MATIFSLPSELILSSLCARFPCRDQQIRSLATLLSIRSAASRNIVLHGLEATGKSSVTKALLEDLSTPNIANGLVQDRSKHDVSSLRYATIKSAECIGGRHLLEQTIGAVAQTLGSTDKVGRCENLAQLVVELGKLMEYWTSSDRTRRLVLVFDGIDRQKDAPPTLLPALARLGEVISDLSVIFIVTSPRPNFLHFPGVPHIEFPAYTKDELMQILALTRPKPQLQGGTKDPQEVTQETWSRFCAAVWDSLAKYSGRDIVSVRSLCVRLWPQFIKPILDGSLNPVPFSRLLLANRSLFQQEDVLVHSIISQPTTSTIVKANSQNQKYQGVGAQLPFFSRLLLVAAYLASFNPPKSDQIFFMKTSAAKRRKKGGGTALTRPGVTKHRKISRKLLGPQAFVLERMLAIFHAIRKDADDRLKYQGKGKEVPLNGAADIQMAIATLASLRLLVRMGAANAADILDASVKYKVAVGWEVVRGIARSVGLEAEDYLMD